MTLACEDANSRFVTDANVDDEDRVGNSLMYTWELMLGNTAIFFQTLSTRFVQAFDVEVQARFSIFCR